MFLLFCQGVPVVLLFLFCQDVSSVTVVLLSRCADGSMY